MSESTNTFALINARRPDAETLYDLLIQDGIITAVSPAGNLEFSTEIDTENAAGKLLLPSLVDAHVHLREPGFEYKEDIQSGLTAAAMGGFGAVMAMANTEPVNDAASITSYMLEQASLHYPHGPRLYPIGALTVGLAGNELAPYAELKEAGAVAISNDGKPVCNNELFRRSVEYAASWGLKVIDHCEDSDLAAGWQMNEGETSASAGLKGQPSVSEAMQVARDILLAEYLNLPIHLAHISCRQSVELIRWAKQRGVPITAETCPHYLLLDDSVINGYNTMFKVSPPLRSPDDVVAMRMAVADGTIDILATDHAPHAAHEKEVPFDEAPFGMIGLETALPVTYSLVRENIITESRLEELWCSAPAQIFNLQVARIAPGSRADFILFDPNTNWIVNRENIHSRSLNSPWLNETLQGKISAHWQNGFKIV